MVELGATTMKRTPWCMGVDCQLVGADLVGDIAIGGDAVGADDDPGDVLGLHQVRGGRIHVQADRDAFVGQLPGGQSRAWSQGRVSSA